MTFVPASGKATTLKKAFSRETSVNIDIQADRSIIWSLLTDSDDYPRWNSTIIYVKGSIALNEKIVLKAKLDPKREFKVKVKELETGKRLVWGDSMGNRIYTLIDAGNGTTNFSMIEKIGSPLFPLFAKMIPPFDNAFETFASDLKREAETKMKARQLSK